MDSSDERGGRAYKLIIEKVIEDLALGGSIRWIYAYIRPEIPLFIIKVNYKEFERKNVLKDLAKFEVKPDAVKVVLDNELDLSETLRALWSEFGRGKVEQIGRQEVLVKDVDLEQLKNVKIRERAISISDKINELVTRVLPEGFRIRHFVKEGDVMTVIASEDPIKKEWIEIASGMTLDA